MILGTETKQVQTVRFGVRKIRNKTSHDSIQTSRCPPKKGSSEIPRCILDQKIQDPPIGT